MKRPTDTDDEKAAENADRPARKPITAQELADFKAELLQLVPQLRAFARFLCQGDRAAADDLAQEALSRAWAARESFTPGTTMRAWLYVIARNLYYSSHRRDRFTGVWDEAHAERTLFRNGDQQVVLELDEVRRAMTLLPTEQREALILVTAGGFAYEEAATVCGCAVGTIKSRVNRARAALTAILASGQSLPQGDAPAEEALSGLVQDARRLADGS